MTMAIAPSHPRRLIVLLPGLLLAATVTGAALLVQWAEAKVFGRAWLEALVLAILIGTAVRSAWTPGSRFQPGIAFGAKTVLEVAVVLLGASISASTVVAAGPALLAGIAAIVAAALSIGYALGRALRLPRRMAVLVACGNAICGNSAIAAVAPVIGADSQDVASSIAFTAVLGVIVVLTLPLVVPVLHLTGLQYGVLAGLTVYAVPQVLAATTPIGTVAIQIGTVVKLVRVLMLGPVVLVLSLLAGRFRDETAGLGSDGERVPEQVPGQASEQISLHKLIPWFILGFLALAGMRSLGLIPSRTLVPIGYLATAFTILSMAALGLGVDVRVVARAGARVVVAVTGSLLALLAMSLGLIWLLGVAG